MGKDLLKYDAHNVYEYSLDKGKKITAAGFGFNGFYKTYAYAASKIDKLKDRWFDYFGDVKVIENGKERVIKNCALIRRDKTSLTFCADNSFLFSKKQYFKEYDLMEGVSFKAEDKTLIIKDEKNNVEYRCEITGKYPPTLLTNVYQTKIDEVKAEEEAKIARQKRIEEAGGEEELEKIERAERQEKARKIGYDKHMGSATRELVDKYYEDFVTDSVFWGGNVKEKLPAIYKLTPRGMFVELGYNDYNPIVKIIKTFLKNAKEGEILNADNLEIIWNSAIRYSKDLFGKVHNNKAIVFMKTFAEKVEEDYTILLLERRAFEMALIDFEETLPPNH